MTLLQANPDPQLTCYLALHHPLLLTVPNLHWWLSGSSFTSSAARRWLQLCEIMVLLLAAGFEPSPLAILLLRCCFTLLGNGKVMERSPTMHCVH